MSQDNDHKEHEIETLKFLVERSRTLLKEQEDSYKLCSTKGGVILSAIGLFITLSFDSTQQSSEGWSNCLKVISVLMAILAVRELFYVFEPKPLSSGFDFDRFEETYRKSYFDALKYEITANRGAYKVNKPIVDKHINRFSNGVTFAVISLVTVFINLLLKTLFY